MWISEKAQAKATSVLREFGQRPRLREFRGVGINLKMLLTATLAVVFTLASYEFTLFAMGSCQGYGGVGAFESSLTGQALDLWSIDPLDCR